MTNENQEIPWNTIEVKKQLEEAFDENSEITLLKTLKQNSFLFYDLFNRKWGIQPIFHEVSFGKFRCDFVWLNDNSSGPEWVLVEVEKPLLELFKKNGEPTHLFSHAMEQVKSWRRYFEEHPGKKKEIFGAVAKFRYILVVGDTKEWNIEKNSLWRMEQHKRDEIEIRSSDVFLKALKYLEEDPSQFWSFAEKPFTKKSSELEDFWVNYGSYMDSFRRIIL